MKPAQNDIFRLISVRGPEPAYADDPVEDVTDSAVVELLHGATVDLERPDNSIPAKLAKVKVLADTDLDKTVVNRIARELSRSRAASLPALRNIAVQVSGQRPTPIDAIGKSARFRREYRDIVDSWLKLALTEPQRKAAMDRHHDLIRAAHLVHLLTANSPVLTEPGTVRQLRTAKVVPPAAWRSRRGRDPEGGNGATTGERGGNPAQSERARQIKTARAQFDSLVRQIDLSESVRAKAHRAFVAWRSRQIEAAGPALRTRRPGFFSEVLSGLFGGSSGAQPSVSPRSTMTLDSTYYTDLRASLSREEGDHLNRIVGLNLPGTFEGVIHEFDTAGFIEDANRLCHQIKVWEDAQRNQLPTASEPEDETRHPLIRAIGWGDLVVARERLIGYDAREIAHIENVMPGEDKFREHERTRTVEQVTEVETTEETESERDVQTTDRYEIQSESQQTIQEEFSTKLGVNTSGRYGLTKVDTSLEVGFQQTKSEARSSSQSVSREIVTKAVERTFERVRELRRLTITEQIRELNRHRLRNTSAGGAAAQPTDISGIYVWVEKLLEVELRHYGTRMLVELYIPEPALSLLERLTDTSDEPRKPAPFTLSPDEVHPGNYMCLAERFGAQDLEPPPAQYIEVGYAWASAPSEDVDADTAEDTVADTIAIPADYRPIDGTAFVSPHPARARYFDVVVAVGGMTVIDWAGEETAVWRVYPPPDTTIDRFRSEPILFDPAHRWPNGVPVSVRAHGHFDKTLVAQVSLRCIRTDEALANWRLRTWEQYKNAHDRLMQEYRSELEARALEEGLGVLPLERPEADNRRVEQDELRKWAIKAMRQTPFDFNAVEQVGDFQEVDPDRGDMQASIARLFEEGFEWEQASYFLQPYFWSRRDTWLLRSGLTAVDARHAAFLRAGSARYVVPVTPGYEDRVLFYLDSALPEADRLNGPPEDEVPEDTTLENLWLELLLDRKPETALGSGTLNVKKNSKVVLINDDSNWRASEKDLGRELYIDGELYTIARVVGPQQLRINEDYIGENSANERYATGSVPYGPPWVVRVPTSLVILSGTRPALDAFDA